MSATPFKASIRFKRHRGDGVALYHVRVERTINDDRPRNPSLPVIEIPVNEYAVPMEEAVDLICDFDPSLVIEVNK